MNRQNIFTKVPIAMALGGLLAAAGIWEVRHVRAAALFPTPWVLGMVGITRGQTVRLNVVNLSPPPDPDAPPESCRVVLSFRDANGRPFTDANGQVVRSEVSLQSGESAFLDLNSDLFAPPSTNADVGLGPARLQLRPFVRVLTAPPDPDRGSLPQPCFPTMEVFDNTTGRTSLFSAGFEPPPDPDRGQ